MATCDIQTLVNQATCLGCLPSGQLRSIKTDLLCDYLVNPSSPPNPPCTNLIPDGATYTDVYTLNLVVGGSYTISFGANETGLYNGAAEILNPHTTTPVTFIASGDGIYLIPSTNFSTVTAIVCGPSCVNLIPEGGVFNGGGQYIIPDILSPGTTYLIIFGSGDTVFLNSDGNPETLNAPGTFLFTTFAGPPVPIRLENSTPGALVTAIICAV